MLVLRLIPKKHCRIFPISMIYQYMSCNRSIIHYKTVLRLNIRTCVDFSFKVIYLNIKLVLILAIIRLLFNILLDHILFTVACWTSRWYWYKTHSSLKVRTPICFHKLTQTHCSHETKCQNEFKMAAGLYHS